MKTTKRLVVAAVLLISGRFLQAGPLTVLHAFDEADGQDPHGALIQGSDGLFYGAVDHPTGPTGCPSAAIFKIDSTGAIFTELHIFAACQVTAGPLIQASDGLFYGPTAGGGSHHKGSVFKIDSTGGGFTTLHSFNGTDGSDPAGGLVEGTDGNFYGTSQSGGAHNGGTVFKMTPSGTITTLHSFNAGAHPFAGLIQASDGLFYGTTEGTVHDGSIFKITSSGTFTQVHVFNNADGSRPTGRLLQASDGNFYGTTFNGGSHGTGVIFKVDSAGNYNVLVNLTNNAHPIGGLIQLPDGLLYGTTFSGGTLHFGAIFKVDPSTGTYTRIFSFDVPDGVGPDGELLLGSDGLLYGNAESGGPAELGFGTVFSFALPPLPTGDTPEDGGLPAEDK